jgi:hypothetical protein
MHQTSLLFTLKRIPRYLPLSLGHCTLQNVQERRILWRSCCVLIRHRQIAPRTYRGKCTQYDITKKNISSWPTGMSALHFNTRFPVEKHILESPVRNEDPDYLWTRTGGNCLEFSLNIHAG